MRFLSDIESSDSSDSLNPMNYWIRIWTAKQLIIFCRSFHQKILTTKKSEYLTNHLFAIQYEAYILRLFAEEEKWMPLNGVLNDRQIERVIWLLLCIKAQALDK